MPVAIEQAKTHPNDERAPEARNRFTTEAF
jgi:hypothetical protein